MRRALRIGAILVVLLLLVPVAVGLASELGGEVVVLHTADDAGETVETRLWVVDDGGQPWLRAGDPESGWYGRLSVRPDVEVTRAGAARAYRAVPVPTDAARDRVNDLMARKYGWADALLDWVRTPDRVIAVRLDEVS